MQNLGFADTDPIGDSDPAPREEIGAMRTIILFPLLALALTACGSSQAAPGGGTAGGGGDRSPGTGGGGGVDGVEFNATWSHKFPPVFVEAGTERDYDCQSWTLGNEEALYVTGVRQENDGAWHHSNWFYVPEDMFGEAETWDCRDEDFDSVAAAISGGVIFAQSTQNLGETFRFPERSAVVVPPRSKIIGALHLANISAADIDTTITMEFETAEAEEIDVALQPLSYLIYSVDIPAQQESRWRMTCPMENAYKNLAEDQRFGIYYALGHYHSWGNYFELSYVNEDGSETEIVKLESVIGDSLGRVIDPPVFADRAPGLKVTCGYNNTTDGSLIWGNDADKEMCMFLAYVGAPVKIVSWGAEPAEEVGMVDGFRTFEAGCGTVTAIPVID